MNRIRRTSKSQNQPAVPLTPEEFSPTVAPDNGAEAEYASAEQQSQDAFAGIAPEGVVSPDELDPARVSEIELPGAGLQPQPPSDIAPSGDADIGGDIEAPVPVALLDWGRWRGPRRRNSERGSVWRTGSRGHDFGYPWC